MKTPALIARHFSMAVWLSALLLATILTSCHDRSELVELDERSDQVSKVKGSSDDLDQATTEEGAAERKVEKEPLEKNVSEANRASRRASSKKLKGFELLTSGTAFGTAKLTLAEGYATADSGVAHTIHRPPYKKVYFISEENKSYLVWDTSTPYPFRNVFSLPVLKCSRITEAGKEKCFGFQCVVLEGFKRSQVPTVRFVLTDQFNAPISLVRGYAKNFHYPEKYGLPIKIEARMREKAEAPWMTLFAVKSIKKSEFESSQFDIPPYRRVKDVADFAFFTPGSNDIEELFEYHFDNKDKKKSNQR